MQRIGSRAQVMHGNAKMTGGGLRKKDLKYNKQGKIVSKKMSQRAKKEKRLQKAGYTTVKGQFGAVNMDGGVLPINLQGQVLSYLYTETELPSLSNISIKVLLTHIENDITVQDRINELGDRLGGIDINLINLEPAPSYGFVKPGRRFKMKFNKKTKITLSPPNVQLQNISNNRIQYGNSISFSLTGNIIIKLEPTKNQNNVVSHNNLSQRLDNLNI